jgi:hypothetical protein
MLKKIIKFLSSLRVTILLISLLGVMFLLSLWIPQKSLVKDWYLQWKTNAPRLVAVLDALHFTDIYSSPILLTLWVLFFVNLALVTWQRIPAIRNRIALTAAKIADPETAGGYPFRESYPLSADMDGPKVIDYLRRRGYTILGDGSGFYGVKNRLSPMASGLFHLSFFLILLGGVTSIYTQFIGYLDLAEGETFQGELQRYVQQPAPTLPVIGSPPKVAFTVKSVVPQASEFTETGLKVELVDRRGRVHNLDINRPYVEDTSSFVLKNTGPAPLFILKDPTGKEIDGGYVKLNVLKGKSDGFNLGEFQFKVKFYPDYVFDDGKDATRSLEFNNPTFKITALRKGTVIAEGKVTKNGAMEFAGYRLEMREMPFWVRFYIIKERGIPIAYAGFIIASLAVLWRLLLFRREIVGAVREEEGKRFLVVAARSEYYKSLAEEEFTKLFHNLFEKSGGAET